MGLQTISIADHTGVTEQDLFGTITGYLSMPLQVFSRTDEYINRQDASIAIWLWSGGSYFFGEGHGQRRAAAGKQQLFPMFRPN